MLQEHVPSTLLRINTNAIVSDDCTGLRRNFKFFSCKFQNSSEGSLLWNAKYLVRKLGVGSESHLEGHFPACHREASAQHFGRWERSFLPLLGRSSQEIGCGRLVAV
eukprot:TRINITY_DN8507_c0_g1_i1.p1 TRINITY_DN8507_c0_g1~~TRINITY_DN8507_c0_g1_i1.p1  ORF type:complete len:107 (-),score=6.53 TRINITY_DN8507_c0_g1_i1:65-385(-)